MIEKYLKTKNQKILSIIIDNNGKSADDIHAAVRDKFPRMSDEEYVSVISQLHNDKYINVLHADDAICAILPQPYALAKMNDEVESRVWHIKYEVAKMVFSFALGYLARLLSE